MIGSVLYLFDLVKELVHPLSQYFPIQPSVTREDIRSFTAASAKAFSSDCVLPGAKTDASLVLHLPPVHRPGHGLEDVNG